MNKFSFLDQSTSACFVWFVFLGPLIGGTYFYLTEMTELSGKLLLLVPIYSYVMGALPSLVVGFAWFVLMNAVHLIFKESFFKYSIPVLMFSCFSSVMLGYVAMHVIEPIEIINTNFLIAGCFSGGVCGFMSMKSIINSHKKT